MQADRLGRAFFAFALQKRIEPVRISSLSNGSTSALASHLEVGPIIAGVQTYVGSGSNRGLLVDANNTNFLNAVPAEEQDAARKAASDYLNSLNRPNAYGTTNTLAAGPQYRNATLLPQQTYSADGTAAQYTSAGSVASPPQTQADVQNPYGEVPQTVSVGKSPVDVQALTPAQISALTNAQVGSLTNAQIRVLSTAQIQALSQREIWDLSQSQIHALSPTQVGALSAIQLQTLPSRRLLRSAIDRLPR